MTARAGLSSSARLINGTQRVGAFSRLPGLIRQLGADPAETLAAAGLSAGDLQPDARVPYAAIGRALREGVLRTGCAHFGLLAGRMWQLEDLGIVGEIVRHSATVGEALETFTVHQHLDSGGALAFLMRRAGIVDLGYAIYQPGVEAAEHFYDAVLCALMNYMRELCGSAWMPSEIFVPHARPDNTWPYRQLLKAPLRFDAEFCALRFPEHWLEHPIAGSAPLRRSAALIVAERIGRGRLVEQVFRALRLLLLSGRNTGDDVAQMLSMHRRTLNRRLRSEGTTFQKLLDEVRFDVACQLLADSAIPLDDVAAALGYASVSPFMRTFRRWSGTTPGRWRRAAACGQLSAIAHAQNPLPTRTPATRRPPRRAA